MQKGSRPYQNDHYADARSAGTRYPTRKAQAASQRVGHVYMPPLSRSIDIGLWQVPHMHRTKAESDKEAVTPGYGTVRAIRWAAKTNKG